MLQVRSPDNFGVHSDLKYQFGSQANAGEAAHALKASLSQMAACQLMVLGLKGLTRPHFGVHQASMRLQRSLPEILRA